VYGDARLSLIQDGDIFELKKKTGYLARYVANVSGADKGVVFYQDLARNNDLIDEALRALIGINGSDRFCQNLQVRWFFEDSIGPHSNSFPAVVG
jgi:hypothetical protein